MAEEVHYSANSSRQSGNLYVGMTGEKVAFLGPNEVENDTEVADAASSAAQGFCTNVLHSTPI